MSSYESYLEIPVVRAGRDRSGVDCWGLTVLIYAEKYGIQLPVYDGIDWKEDKAAWLEMAEYESHGWREIPAGDRREGDVVLLRVNGVPWHVGVLIDTMRFIHADAQRGVLVEKLGSIHWRSRVVGYYRLKDTLVEPAPAGS